jgi:hypothetical protein
LEEDLAMGEQEHPPGNPGGKPGPDPDLKGEAREDALLREVLRKQELHREGGIEPELDERNEDPTPQA